MDIIDLLSLKAEYEKELVLAQAKVSVITDIICRAEAKNQEPEPTCVESEEPQEQNETEGY